VKASGAPDSPSRVAQAVLSLHSRSGTTSRQLAKSAGMLGPDLALENKAVYKIPQHDS
jgi:hypothetical protein